MDKTNAAENLSAAQEAQPPATIEEPYTVPGMEDIDGEDLSPPRLRIVQPTSKEGNAGTFRLSTTGEEWGSLDVAFLKLRKGRVLFDKDLKKGAICGSRDRKFPAPDFETPMNTDCLSCPYKDWDGRTPPECNETYDFLGVCTEDLMPFFLSLRSTAVKPAKGLITSILMKARSIRENGKPAGHMCDVSVNMSLKKVDGDKGVFYVPVFSGYKVLKDTPFRGEEELYQHEEAKFETEGPLADQGGEAEPV